MIRDKTKLTIVLFFVEMEQCYGIVYACCLQKALCAFVNIKNETNRSYGKVMLIDMQYCLLECYDNICKAAHIKLCILKEATYHLFHSGCCGLA